MKSIAHSKSTRLFAYFHLMRKMAQQGHLPVTRQIFEMILLFIRRGLGPGYYLFGHFWRRDIPLRSKLRHLNERAYSRKLGDVNKPAYQKLSQHKVAEKALFSLFSIPSPKFYGHLHPLSGLACNNSPLRNGMDLSNLLVEHKPQAICFKLVEGWGGTGFQAAEINYDDAEPKLISMTDSAVTNPIQFVDETLALRPDSEGYVIEEYCRQHSWYSSLNPSSVNTLRIYAMCTPGKPGKLLGGYLRVGRHNSITDNASTGGLWFVLDPNTGVLGPGVFDEVGSAEYSAHPDSGILLEGQQVPYWDAVCQIVPKVMSVFPYTQFAGLDIAVTEEGPILIEINCQPDRGAACDIGIPTLDMLTP
jgi:hypothetical protein